MTVLLVSANPLFREILASTVRHAGVVTVWTELAEIEDAIKRQQPEVVLVDGSLPPAALSKLLYLVTAHHCSHIILVDPRCNELTLLELHTTTVVSIDDLVNAVRDGLEDLKTHGSAG